MQRGVSRRRNVEQRPIVAGRNNHGGVGHRGGIDKRNGIGGVGVLGGTAGSSMAARMADERQINQEALPGASNFRYHEGLEVLEVVRILYMEAAESWRMEIGIQGQGAMQARRW
jgi:hypothetical protein